MINLRYVLPVTQSLQISRVKCLYNHGRVKSDYHPLPTRLRCSPLSHTSSWGLSRPRPPLPLCRNARQASLPLQVLPTGRPSTTSLLVEDSLGQPSLRDWPRTLVSRCFSLKLEATTGRILECTISSTMVNSSAPIWIGTGQLIKGGAYLGE
jgi:hypothetical protein